MEPIMLTADVVSRVQLTGNGKVEIAFAERLDDRLVEVAVIRLPLDGYRTSLAMMMGIV